MAFHINETFYGQHFVWCSPVYDTGKLEDLNVYKKIPPSSNPYSIYSRCKQDVAGGDFHSAFIIQNKSGIKKGAIEMLKKGMIDKNDFARIDKIVDTSIIQQFSPLVYVISRNLVEDRLNLVTVETAANPLSVEYQIYDLKKYEFEIVHF